MRPDPREVGDAAWNALRLQKLTEAAGQAPNGTGSSIVLYDAGDIDPTQIPPRQWLLGVTFCRRVLSGLIAEGGVGKTGIRYAQELALASGRNLTGEHVHHRGRVLIVCLEDDLNEVERRIAAAMLHHRVTSEEVKGWLYFCTPRGLKLLQTTEGGARSVGLLHTELSRLIPEIKADLVGIDPFVKAHAVEENDNGAVDDVCTMLSRLADEFNCAIDLVHHARKGTAIPGDADRSRGASSMVSAGRLMRTVTTMTLEEAKLFGVAPSDRPALIRVDDAKVNLMPKSSDASWFRLVGVAIGNTEINPLYPRGDNVQTVERWTPPDLWQGSVATFNAILDEIDAGLPGGRFYSHAPAAKERAAWKVVQAHMDRTDDQAKEIIKTWIKNGVLTIVEYEDDQDRKPRKGLRSDPTKRPG